MNGFYTSFPFNKRTWNRCALLTCAEMRKAEELNCDKKLMNLFGLMKNAGSAIARIAQEKWSPCRVLVVCGPGNNGGDGFVAAEILRQKGWQVSIGAMKKEQQTEDSAHAKKLWQGETLPLDEKLLENADLVIDALFGTGLQRPLEGSIAQFVEKLNETGLPVLAADFPSGIDGDTGKVLGTAVKAKATVTFFRKKRGHLLLPGSDFCGEIIVDDIGIDETVLDEINHSTAENSPALWAGLMPKLQSTDHKYTRGHALVYGGAEMTGASRLAARAAQRIGAGMVTLAASEKAIPIYASALESVIVKKANAREEWLDLLHDQKKNAVLIGPGAGLTEEISVFVIDALKSGKKCVLDADALTVFEKNPNLLFESLHPSCVLTPHEGEFVRLFKNLSAKDKITKTQEAARIANCIVLLKGKDTVIASPDGHAIVNHNAPPWLATAGSGDVLAGMILGLITAGMPSFPAAACAAFVHGEIAMGFGKGLIAEDIVDGIPKYIAGLLV